MKKMIPFFVLLLCGVLNADAQPPMNMNKIDCSALASEMQQFAAGLTDANRLLFCNMFNDNQRNTTMELAGQPDAAGNMMTSDQAVAKVAQDGNISAPPPASTGTQGGCPVK
jgi:hypothetical protein